METIHPNSIRPDNVRDVLSEHILTKGMMPMVLDMDASQGSTSRMRKPAAPTSISSASTPPVRWG